jgi:protein phosphatase
MRHVLTMAVGLGAPLAINYYSLRLKPGAQILLCTDGLHGVISEEQIESILEGPDTLAAKCGRLVDSAKRSGGPDNITCILLRAAA